MEVALIAAIVVLSVLLGREKKRNLNMGQLDQAMLETSRHRMSGSTMRIGMTPEQIGREAENMRRATEGAFRTRAEGLVETYDKSALVADLVNTIRDCVKYGIIWDIELNDSDISITTMTDALENRICLMTERYDYQTMGYQNPPRESEHRLAMALALQKKLGQDYGIEYQFQYNPINDQFVLSDLTVSYRKKELGNETTLKSPI